MKRRFLFLFLFFLLFYTRFVGLNWGLPYPMHPDERNMVNALQNLRCEIPNSKFQIPNQFSISNFQFLKQCFNPHFFAYGQFPLYLGYFLIQVYHFVVGRVGLPITFEEATISLRIISAVASIINVLVLVKIIKLLVEQNQKSKIKNQKLQLKIKNLNFTDFLITNHQLLISFLILIFSPYFIQLSHFGTTESLLMLFYSLIIYYSLQLFNILKWKTIFFVSFFSGLAIATKVSAIIFIAVPFITLISNIKYQKSKIQIKYQKLFSFNNKAIKQWGNLIAFIFRICIYLFLFLSLTAVFALFFSPHNLISFSDFLGSINYESAVALGKVKVFYTRQFEMTIPIWFQLTKIFPYALGWPGLVLSFLGFLSYLGDKRVNLLRFAFLVYFLPNSFLYAKWTRFMAPILPLISVFATLFLLKIKVINVIKIIIVILTIIPGIAYLSIYQNPDVRFTASSWIYKNIPQNSFILFETANVVDVPIPVQSSKFKVQSYQGISFNFYDIDINMVLREEFYRYLAKADYIFVPSRRVFMNHYCDSKLKVKSEKLKVTIQSLKFLDEKKCNFLKEKYPVINDYYNKLFSGELGFKKIAEFTSYPRIEFFGKTLIEFPDENAEETWSVFDHPVIRIYKRV